MSTSSNNVRIGIAVAVILGTIGWLAFTGYGSSKSYYVTIAELGGLGDKAYKSNLRVEGFVQPGSIEQNGTHVTFVLNEFESHSPKAADGPAAEGDLQGHGAAAGHIQGRFAGPGGRHFGRDGVFHANVLQAKCASKYAPASRAPSRAWLPQRPSPWKSARIRAAPARGQPAPVSAN